MRIAFLLLLLINLLTYLWSAGYLGLREPGREPERLAAQIKPDKLHVLAPLPTLVCQQWSPLDELQLEQLRKQLATSNDIEIDTHESTLPGSFWVAISGIESRELAVRKKTELGKLGITDIQLIEDARHGPLVVVLGSFTDTATAQSFLDTLAPRGVRSARLVTREAPSVRYRISLKWPEPVSRARDASVQAWLATLPADKAPQREACATP